MKCRLYISKIIFGIIFLLCLSIIFIGRIIVSIDSISVNAESSSENLVINNWGYFCYLEESYRNQHPNATYEEVSAYLEEEVLKAEQNGIILPMGSSFQEKLEKYSEGWNKLNEEERRVTFLHPIKAITAFNASLDAINMTGKFFGQANTDDDNGNAFRHAYWNALMTQRINESIAKEFADAHEYGQTGLSSTMDLQNNEIGRSDGLTYSNYSYEELAFKILERVSYGHYWRIIDNALIPTDWRGLLPEYFGEVMLNVTILWDNEIRVNYVNIDIQGTCELPETIKGLNVTEIGANAFANQTQITSVTLPNSITEIGEGAFSGCTSLTSVTLSNSLGIIQEKAFENCVSLTNVNMPSATSISSHAFKGCTSLINITVPANTTRIGEGAFTGCNALNISVNATNPYYCAENNILYSKDKTYIYATGGISSDVIIPETVTRMEEYAFCNNSNLECVHIYGTPTICSYAFWNCENLEEVYFYSYDVPSIGIGTFTDSIFKLYVPHSSQNEYYEIFAGNISSIASIPINVTVMENGVVQQIIPTYYGALIADNFVPLKSGYVFDYCTDTNGKIYQNGGVWDSTENLTVDAYWIEEEPEIILYNVVLDKQGGVGGTDSVNVEYLLDMPTATAPSREEYIFKGYFAEPNGEGTQYYNANMTSINPWDMESDGIIYADWEEVLYEIVVWLAEDDYDNQISEVAFGDPMLPNMHIEYIYNRTGYDLQGIYSEPNGKGVKYFDFEIVKPASEYVYKLVGTGQAWNQKNDGMVYAYWTLVGGNYEYSINISNADEQLKRTISLTHGTNVTITAPSIDGYTFESMWVNGTTYTTSTVQLNNVQLRRNLGYEFLGNVIGNEPFHIWYMPYGATTNQGGLHMTYKKNECVAAGTLITLADGSQVPVETLTGNERLLVWNLHTGRFDTAPILFIDHDSAQVYKIINLYFSDGTRVKVISEHAFWDFDLNKYVFLREDAAQYLGHWFNKQTTDAMGNMVWTRVQLTSVTITEEYTTAWSPVTYGHLCIYVNGMLSMPGATSGLINIFEVDGETMQINQEQYLADIATYGLFTYEEFAELYPIPEEMFNAVNGQYLKVSIGKGLIDYETLGILIETYSHFFE